MNSTERKFIAVDPSLVATGVSVFEGNRVVATYLIKTTKGQATDRYADIALQFWKIIKTHSPHGLAIETQYMFGVNTNAILKVATVTGIIKGVFAISKMGAPMIDIAPNSAKKAVGITKKYKRAEGKKAIKLAVQKRFPYVAVTNQDIADSIAIGVAGRQVFKERSLLDKFKNKLDKV